jgi:hypothetical protein
VASVASWLGRETCSFSAVAGETVRGAGGLVHRGAGRGCRRIGGSMSCRRACSARLGKACVHGNASPTLHVLGGTIALEWHGQGAVYGGSEGAASRGIGRGCAGKLDGEVTDREMVGAVLPKLGVHGSHGGVLGRAWGRSIGHWEMGSSSPARLDDA